MDAQIKTIIQLVNLTAIVVLVLTVLFYYKKQGVGNSALRYFNRAMLLTSILFLIANIFAFTVSVLAFNVYDFHRPMVIILGNLSDRISMLAAFLGLYSIGKMVNKISINDVSK